MRSRSRRRASPIADLDVTAFINLMVVLVAFFLSSVTYFQFSALELKIPGAADSQTPPKAALELEIIIRKDALEVNDRNGGLLRRLDNAAGAYAFKDLNDFLQQIKARYPDKTDATILAEADIPYDILVKTMDATRAYTAVTAGKIAYTELFPELSIGDAPQADSARTKP